MNIFVLMCITIVFISPAMAATLNLTDGRSVSGTIVEQDAKSVVLNVNGLSMTYYSEEIKDIDGVPVPKKPKTNPYLKPKVVSGSAAAGSGASAPVTSSPPAATTASAGDKKQLILKFIDVFGTKDAMTQNLNAMLTALPEGPEKVKLNASIKVDEIIERLVPIYDKQFSEQDLNEYIAFYSSPEGKRLVSSIAVIMRDSVAVSTQYFKEKFPELMQEDKN